MTDPVQAQLEAYNARDVEAFVRCYAPDAEIVSLPAGTSFAGHDAIRTVYSKLFAGSPDLHCELRGRLRAGAWTVDEEHITRTQDTTHCLVAYQVAEGLIQRAICLVTPGMH